MADAPVQVKVHPVVAPLVRLGGVSARVVHDEAELALAAQQAVEHGLALIGQVVQVGRDDRRVEELLEHVGRQPDAQRQVAHVQPARAPFAFGGWLLGRAVVLSDEMVDVDIDMVD